MVLKTRQPTGRPSHPCVLISGPKKTGKSWMAAEFTGHPKIGRAFWMEVGTEGDADQYAAIPGAKFEIVEHNSDWSTIYGSVCEVHDEAHRARAAGRPPVLFTLDQGGAVWDLLTGWARNRAAESKANKRLLADDPNADVQVSHAYWNPATDRWRAMMTKLVTFPGIVLILSRGEVVSEFTPDGNLVPGSKIYKVAGHRSLEHDVTASVRLDHQLPPQIIGGRSVHVDMRPAHFRPEKFPNFSLEWLIFDALRYDPETARIRENIELRPGSAAPLSDVANLLAAAIETSESREQVEAAWTRVKLAREEETITAEEYLQLHTLTRTAHAKFPQAPEPTERVNGHRAALAGVAGR